jgi:hypothetical protein
MPNLVISMAGKKKVSERRSGLCPSEKEVPERRFGAFRHKNTPGLDYLSSLCFPIILCFLLLSLLSIISQLILYLLILIIP